jgi:NAD(P)-dependent dehydrogenase (short-subunit alcohol dehydrogenase family)
MTASRTILITGASRGIGAATARLAAGEGWAVVVNYRTQPNAAQELVNEIVESGGQAIAIYADMQVESEIVAMFAEIDVRLPLLGCLVNNAARVAPEKISLDRLDAQEINSLLAVNVTGTIIATREAARRMATNRGGQGGSIINVSSLSAKHGAPNLFVHYAASKGAVDTFTYGAALELAGHGVRVNAVRPGLIDTEVHARAGMPDRIDKVGPRMPMGRSGRPEEVAEAIIWLASERASYVTGTIMDVGGGA